MVVLVKRRLRLNHLGIHSPRSPLAPAVWVLFVYSSSPLALLCITKVSRIIIKSCIPIIYAIYTRYIQDAYRILDAPMTCQNRTGGNCPRKTQNKSLEALWLQGSD